MIFPELLSHTQVISIVGDVLKIRAAALPWANWLGWKMAMRLRRLHKSRKSIAIVSRCKCLPAAKACVRTLVCVFRGMPHKSLFSDEILGRVFNGVGEPIDGGPQLLGQRRVDVGGPSVNPMMRVVPSKMIETKVPMIDVFNCLVESQKIPIFSIAGEPYNELLARIAIQADADVVVFCGLGLIFDEFHFFRDTFENEGVFPRTVMFANRASDPIVERLLAPDLALKVAERFAVEQNKRVLVLMTDMTAFADALKEIGVAMERIPSNRGYMGDLYSQLALRYERACDYRGAGSVTLLAVTTMPGNDVTHPVPDNTGYITEGQFYLHDGMIDPFGSLVTIETAGDRQGHSRRPLGGDEHHDPFVFGGSPSRTEATDGVRVVGDGSQVAEVRRVVHRSGSCDSMSPCRWKKPWIWAGKRWRSVLSHRSC